MSSNVNKIGFIITSTGWGGLEMNTLKLAESLSLRGFEITLFTQEESTIFKKGKAIFYAVEIIQKERKYFDFKSAKNFSKILKNNSIYRLLVVDNKDLDVVAWCKKLYFKELKVVYQQHMQIGINKKDVFHTFRFKAIDVWVSPLTFLKNEISVRTKFPESRVRVLPIGLETSAFDQKKYDQREAQELMNIPSNRPLIGIIGRISVKKGQLFVAQALLRLKELGIEFNLLIFGSATVNASEDKQYAEDLNTFVKQNDLEQYVFFEESQPDIAKFFNAIDIFVLASHSETYGMVTIEAMLNNLPILATNSGGTPEILGYGEYGTLFHYNDQEDFTKKLSDILENKEEALQKASKAKSVAKKNYDIGIEVDGFVEIFNDLKL